MKVYIDGQFYEKNEAKVSVFDHGVLYGDGVFEGIRSYNGRVFRLREHLDRLYDSAKAILLDVPMTKKEMEEVVCQAIRTNGLKDAYIRVLVTRGVGDLGLDMRKCLKASIIVIADKIQLYPEEVYNRGLTLMVSHLRRVGPTQLSPTIKSLNYLNNILARAEASRANCDEAILLNEQGYVSECSGDNIFFIRDNKLYTPPVWVGILEGITRMVAMELGEKQLGLHVEEKVFTLPQLYRADEVFVTGTGAEIIGVIKVNGRIIGDGKPGPITKNLIAAFRDYVKTPEAGVEAYQTAAV
jgi:branched-chain amino acid aminotransferase